MRAEMSIAAIGTVIEDILIVDGPIAKADKFVLVCPGVKLCGERTLVRPSGDEQLRIVTQELQRPAQTERRDAGSSFSFRRVQMNNSQQPHPFTAYVAIRIRLRHQDRAGVD